MMNMHRKLATIFLLGCGVLFLSGCGETPAPEPVIPQEKTPTMSDRAAQEITNYIQEPQQKAREANQAILDADQARRKALDDL